MTICYTAYRKYLFKNVHRDPCLHWGMHWKESDYWNTVDSSLCPVLLFAGILTEHELISSIHSSCHQSNPLTTSWITVVCVSLLPIHQDESELFFFLFFFCPPPCVWMDGWMQQVELVLSWPRSITTEGLLLSNKNSTNSWHKSLLKTVLHCQNKSNLYISWARAFYTNKTKS